MLHPKKIIKKLTSLFYSTPQLSRVNPSIEQNTKPSRPTPTAQNHQISTLNDDILDLTVVPQAEAPKQSKPDQKKLKAQTKAVLDQPDIVFEFKDIYKTNNTEVETLDLTVFHEEQTKKGFQPNKKQPQTIVYSETPETTAFCNDFFRFW